MNVGGIGRSTEVAHLRSTTATSNKASDSAPAGSGEASSVSLSKPAEMLQKLSALQESDPAKFKEVVGQIAEKLQAAADSEEGGGSEMLSDLASRFAEAAETGDLSALQPPSREPPAESSNGAGRARDAYSKNRPPPPPPNDSVKQALDDAFSLVDAATSSVS